MTATLDHPPAAASRPGGGAPARRAVVRWAWRLFRREWRQQLLVLGLIAFAVAATVLGGGVAADSPPPAHAGFGTADYAVSLTGSGPRLATQVAALTRRFHTVDVIQNQTLTIPGSVDTYQLRAQDPDGPYGKPMLSLVHGRYPTGSDEIAVSTQLAATLGLRLGEVWHQPTGSHRIVGLVENPQSLLDRFALVAPGELTTPSQTTVLFDSDAAGVRGLHAQSASSRGNGFSPQVIVLVLATLGMLLIGLVSVAGFTVLAQRRLRSIGMLGALGASPRNVRLVVRANGAVTGLVGTAIGAGVGFAGWLLYRPHLQLSVHHTIGVFQLPWTVVISAMVLAVVTCVLAASRPARTVTRVPIVSALAGRPAAAKGVHRSALPGAVLVVLAYVLIGLAGGSNGNGGGVGELLLGLVALVLGVVLLAPLGIAAAAAMGRNAPIAVRLALRDLARYRARSGAALGAITLGVLIAVLTCVAASARYSNVVDYAGPNLASDQLLLQPAVAAPQNGPPPTTLPEPSAAQQASARAIAGSLGASSVVTLQITSATLQRATSGPNFNGALYVATPQLLRSYGVTGVDPRSLVLTMRPGLDTTPHLQLIYGHYFSKGAGAPGGPTSFPCPAGSCVADPAIQHVGSLPSGTSAPNTVITEHAVQALHLAGSLSTTGWLVVAPAPLTATQVNELRQTAAANGLTVETKSEAPSSAEVLNLATAAGILLALALLAMTVGLIRAETASDLRTLAATGASRNLRRAITAVTAGTLAAIGAVLGTAAAYVAGIAWFRDGQLGQSLATNLSQVPVTNLLLVLVGLPVIAIAGGWLFAGRQPAAISRQPTD